MRCAPIALAAVAAAALAAAALVPALGDEESAGARPVSPAVGRPAPEFPSLATKDWAGKPVSLSSLRGRVVVLNVWTFGCANCQRTLPWLRAMAKSASDRDVAVIGIHTPEFDRERDRDAVVAAIEREGLSWPSYIDNGSRMWDALGNKWWPATYLVDRLGIVRFVQIGEIHEGDPAAAAFDTALNRLLKERAR